MLIVALLLSRERGSVQPSAATNGLAPSRAATSNLSVVDEPPGAPTYPVPPEVIAALRARETASAPTESTPVPMNEGKGATAPPSHAPARAPARKVVPAPRGESRSSNTRGIALASRRPPAPSAAVATTRPPPADHTATPTSSASTPAAETRKRVPLVDDQPRVRILE
jgi:hypothetical protein